jgi:RNA polymerase sigma factor (sigma-70 family)
LWAAARVPAAWHEFHPTNDAGGPASSTGQAGRTDNPYCLQMQPLDFSDYGLDRVEQLASQGDRTLQAVLNSLTGAERDAVQARIIEERSYDEIARTLGCSETVVRQRVSRGLSRARRRLTNPRPGEADS